MSIRPALPTAAAVLLAMLGSAACAADTTDTGTGDSGVSPTVTPVPTPAPATPTAPTAAEVGQLGFTGTTLDGKPFAASALAGKPVLLWFWAPWCPTCVAEAPDVLAVQQKYAGKVGILGVAGLDEQKNMQRFVDRTKTGGITHLADSEGGIWRRFEVTQQSTYVLLDASGAVTFRGIAGGDELDDKIAALVG